MFVLAFEDACLLLWLRRKLIPRYVIEFAPSYWVCGKGILYPQVSWLSCNNEFAYFLQLLCFCIVVTLRKVVKLHDGDMFLLRMFNANFLFGRMLCWQNIGIFFLH